jgi:hypothetical protein
MTHSPDLFSFRSLSDVQSLIPAPAGVNQIIQLTFPKSSSSDSASLFAHHNILALCSKVMGNVSSVRLGYIT